MVRRALAGHADTDFRPDIEGLRAIAVLAVVLYHVRLPGVRGGFVGVDVFFVVSGFLITRLLLAELATTGTVSRQRFWARRARRILPAATLTVVVTVVLARSVLAPLALPALGADAIGAGTFTINFVFAHRLGDYFGAQLGATNPSPLLHYWSLAVEEQFYLLWPALLVLLTRRPAQYRRLLAVTVTALAAVGFVVGMWLTDQHPSWAFFLLPARMGELLGGAGLAVAAGAVLRLAAPLRAALGWVGLAGIVVACSMLDESVPWPGRAVLLPVLATMAVIVSGTAPMTVPWAPLRVLRIPSLQWLGRHSFALYLWHWPLLVLAQARWGPLTWPERIVLVGVAVALSAASVRFVEDPVRHARTLSARPALSLALGAALCAVTVGLGVQLRSSVGALDGGVTAAAPDLAAGAAVVAAAAPTTTVAATTTTIGSATTIATTGVTPTTLATPDPPSGRLAALVASTQRALQSSSGPAAVPSNLDPPLAAARDRSAPYDDGCVNAGVNPRLQPCEYGVKDSARTILLYGDSHAVQWFEPLQQIALARGYRLVILIKGGCPVAAVNVPTPNLHFTCPPYRDRAIDWIAEHQPDLVVVANSYTQYPADADEWAAGADETIGRLADASPHVVVIGDNPASTVDPPACLSGHLDDTSACATARDDAIRPDRISAEVAAARAHGVRFVDTTDWFCTATTCPTVVGNVLVMRDETHITVAMAELLEPLLDAAVAPSLS